MSDKQGAIYLYCSECQWVGENSEVEFWSPEDGAYCPKCDHRDSLIEFAPEMYSIYLKMKDNPVKTVFMMFDSERQITALTTERDELRGRVRELEATLAGIRSTLKRNHWHGREVDDLYREEPTK